MTTRFLPTTVILSAGLLLGFAADQLLRAPGEPGLNVLLLFAGLTAAVFIVAQRSQSPLGTEAAVWVGVGVLCASALVWRGSEVLRFGAFVAACVAFTIPALHAGQPWLRRSGIVDVIESVVGAWLHAAFGSARLMTRTTRVESHSTETPSAARSMARTVVRGALLAFVPLLVFGALFISADQVFASIVSDVFRFDLAAFGSHMLLTAILSWLFCGYLVGLASGTRLDALRRLQPARPTLGRTELAIALGLVDLLFLAFVLVQFRYLFGGDAWVELTPGLTYAAYAREGFFQLVAAVGLAIPWLLVTHALLDDRDPRARSMFLGFAGVQLVLLFAIVASAVQRMLAYQNAYGLTEDRVVVTAILSWLTVVLVWYGVTVFSGRRARFMFGVVVTAYLTLGTLLFINPAHMVARHNLDHVATLGEVDAEYLAMLGSDAAPLLVSRLDTLPPASQCVVAKSLLRKWGPDVKTDWRTFNWSERRARAHVANSSYALHTAASAAACGSVGTT